MSQSESFRSDVRPNLYGSESSVSFLGQLSQRPVPNRVMASAQPAIQQLAVQAHQVANGEFIESDECLMSQEEMVAYSLLDIPRSFIDCFKTCLAKFKEPTIADSALRFAANALSGGLTTGGSGENELDGLTSPAANFEIWNGLFKDLYEKIEDKSSPIAELTHHLGSGLQKLANYCNELDVLSNSPFSEEVLYTTALRYTQRAHDLAPGDSELFYGGWSNEVEGGGHAMIFEIKKSHRIVNGVAHFNVLVYTSTGFQLTDCFQAGNKVRLRPLIRYANIPETVLFFNDDGVIRPALIQSFIELNVLAKKDLDRKVSSEDVLQIFDYLQNYLEPVSYQECGAITGQRAGTCVPSVTKVWIRSHTPNLALYKQIMFHVKLKLLVVSYHSLKEIIEHDTPKGHASRRMLVGAARKVLRRTVKLLEGVHGFGPLIDPEVALEARATAHMIIAYLTKIEERLALQRSQEMIGSAISFTNPMEQRQNRQTLLFNQFSPSSNGNIPNQRFCDLSYRIFLDESRCVESFMSALTKTLSECAGIRAQSRVGRSHALQIHHFIDQVPLPQYVENRKGTRFKVELFENSFWQWFSLDELKQAQKLLHELSLCYSKNESYKSDLITRRFATILPLQVLSHFLALKIDAQKHASEPDQSDKNHLLESYLIPSFQDVLELKELMYLDRNEFERIQQAANYVTQFNALNSLSFSKPLFESEASTNIKQSTIEKSVVNGIYWQALLNPNRVSPSAQEFIRNVTGRGNALFPDFSAEEIEKTNQEELRKRESDYQTALTQYEGKKRAYDATMVYKEALAKWNASKLGAEPSKPNPYQSDKPYPPPRLSGDIARMVNVPPITKQLAVLEIFSSIEITNDHPLDHNDYKHIFLFRKTLLMSRKLMREKQPVMGLKRVFYRNPYSYHVQILCEDPKNDIKAMEAFASSSLRALSASHQQLFDYPVTQRKEAEWKKSVAEGVGFQSHTKQSELLNRLLRTLSQWKLTPNQLIYELGSEFSELQNPSLQALIFRFFFRSPLLGDGKTELGVGELILHDDALFENVCTFTQKGLTYLFNADEDVSDAARFFFELSFYLTKYLADAGQTEKANCLNQIDEIKRWIDEKKLSDQKLSKLYLYSIAFYSLKEVLTFDDLTLIYSNLVLYKLFPKSDTNWKSPVLEEQVENFILKLLTTQRANFATPAFVARLGPAVFAHLKLDNQVSNAVWKIDPFPYLTNGEWRIDLGSGKIYGKLGEIKGIDKDYPWEKSPDFQRLFPNETGFTYRAVGQDCVLFTHPSNGSFRIVTETYYGRVTHHIQKKIFKEDFWFDYCSPESAALKRAFPASILFDYALWTHGIGVTVGNQPIKSYFSHLKTQKEVYALLNDGKLVEVEGPNKLPRAKGSYIDYVSAFPSRRHLIEGLARFDDLSNVLVYRNSVDHCERVSFARYVSVNGNTLSFINQQERWVWNENREYVLSGAMPKYMLGTIVNYLFLESIKKPSAKDGVLLVPFQKIVVKDPGPSASGELDIANIEPLKLHPKEQHNALTATQKYLVFEVEEGVVKATSLESKLFLAYIYFSQKKYAESIQLFKSIKPSETITPLGLEILERIQELSLGEDDPDAKMVIFKALVLTYLQKDKDASEVITEYFGEDEKLARHIKNYTKFLQSYNNVSVACALTFEEEALLLPKLIREGLKKVKELSTSTPEIEHYLNRLDERYKQITERKKATMHLIGAATRTKDLKSANYAPYTPFVALVPIVKKDNVLEISWLSLPAAREDFLNKKRTAEEEYNTALEKAVQWLTSGQEINPQALLRSQYTRPPVGMSLFKNGPLFLAIYRIAKSNNRAAQQDMYYRLTMWRMHTPPPNQLLDCLIAIISNPHVFPDNNVMQLGVEEKYHFLCKVESIYSQKQNQLQLPNPAKVQPLPQSDSFHGYSSSASPQKQFPVLLEAPFERRNEVLDPSTPPIPLNRDFSASLKEELGERWSRLNQWREHFLHPDPNHEPIAYQDFQFKMHPGLLSDKESDYAQSLENSLKELQKDYDAGKEQNRKSLKTISTAHCHQLVNDAEAVLKQLQEKRQSKEVALLALANTKSSDVRVSQAERARLGGNIDAPLGLLDCIECLLSYDARAFERKNKNVDKPEIISELIRQTLDILDIKSYEAQLKRIVETANELKKIDATVDRDAGAQAATRRYLCEKLESDLEAKYHFESFSPEEQIVFRVFCGQTGFIPFKKQMDLIKLMLETEKSNSSKYKDIVIQLIMGGGKTSVIATLILFLAAKRKGRLGFFIVPPSLFQTVCANIGESLFSAFGKTIISINLTRDDFTVYKLDDLHKQLVKARDRDLPSVVNAMTLQGLELELISLIRKMKTFIFEQKNLRQGLANPHSSAFSNTQAEKIKQITTAIQELGKKGKIISSILSLSRHHADGLLDEVDLILDCFQEVNFVDGEKVAVDATRNLLLLSIYKGLTSAKLVIKTPNGPQTVREYMKLHTNNQALVDKNDYIAHVAPVIAAHLGTTFKPIADNLGTYLNSFIRYASGQMHEVYEDYAARNDPLTEEEARAHPLFSRMNVEQVVNDIAFLKHLNRLSLGRKEQKEAADLISLSKHFLLELTHATLKKIGKRNYGVVPKKVSDKEKKPAKDAFGKIIPFLGVNTPATTEFGYHWESGCYYYQWGSAFKPEQEQIFEIARMTNAAARYYVQKNGEKFEETAEFLDFFDMFHVRLDEIQYPGKVEQAIDYISQDSDKLLDMQYELVARHATFATERLTSNGFALGDLIDTERSMSGTPWNVDGFEEQLASRFVPDLGTEGRILQKLAEKCPNKPVIEADFEGNATIQSFLEQMHQYYQSQSNGKQSRFFKVRGIIESGAQFKTFGKNAAIAKGWMEFLHQKQVAEKELPLDQKSVDPAIDAVLFFDTDPGEIQPNTLYVWRKEASAPERIGSSTKKALSAKGLYPSNYVIYYDERHTTGTDVPQIPEAVNLMTFDESMLTRTQTQSLMRPRLFLFEQDVDMVVNKATRSTLYNHGKVIADLSLHAAKTQSIRKTQCMVRYFTQQIHHIFRRHSVSKIFQAFDAQVFDLNFAQTVVKYEPYFVSYMKEEPYLQHGSLKSKANTKGILLHLLERKSVAFFKESHNLEIIQAVRKQVEDLKKWIECSQTLPNEWIDSRNSIGVEQEVEQQVEQEVDIRPENEVEREIEIELQRYEQPLSVRILEETVMGLPQFLNLVEDLKSVSVPSRSVIPLKEQLTKYPYDPKTPFHQAFQEPIFGTDAFFYVGTNRICLSVFHALQRPAKQILVVRDQKEKYKFLLLSEHEANDVREHLSVLYTNNPAFNAVWLVQPDGKLLVRGELMDDFPVDEDFILKGMLEINAFTGNVDYLDKDNNREDTDTWLAKDPALKIHFLKLRTFRNKTQQDLLRTSISIANASGKYAHKILSAVEHTCKRRREWEKAKAGSFIPKRPFEAKLLESSRQVRNLNTAFVPYLGIDWDKRDTDETTRSALGALSEKRGINGEALQKAAEELTIFQFSLLREFQGPHLTADQIQFVPCNKVGFLTKPTQFVKTIEHLDGRVERVYFIKAHQVKGLVESQEPLIPYINPEFYNEFDKKWQVEMVPPEHLRRINPQLGYMLTQAQIESIPVQHAALIAQTNGQIPQDVLSFYARLQESMTPEQLSWLPIDLLETTPTVFYRSIRQSQIQKITDAHLIPKLEALAASANVTKGLWTSWITPQMVLFITEEQVPYLKTKEQIVKVTDAKVPLLQPQPQVPLIAANQVKFLVGSNQIQACPNVLVKELQSAQVCHIQASQVKGLSNALLLIIKAIHPLWETLRLSISVEQIYSFDSIELVALLKKDQISAHLKKAQVGFLMEEWQIQACSSRCVPALSEAQIRYIQSFQVPFLEGSVQIQAIPTKELFAGVRKMRFISDQQLQWITPQQVPHLSNPQLLRLKEVNPDWENLNKSISPNQIGTFNSAALVALLAADQIHNHLMAQQVQFLLQEWQIKACPNHLVRYLSREQIPMITPDQVGFVENRDPVQAIPSQVPYMNRLLKRQFAYLSPGQVALLTPQQIQLMDQYNEVSKLVQAQWTHLQQPGISTFMQREVLVLQNEVPLYDKIPFIRGVLLNYIQNPEAIKRVSDAQVDTFGWAGFNQLNDQHPLWNRITPQAIRGLIVSKIKNISLDQLKFLENPQSIRSISKWNFIYLKRDQLKHRKAAFFTYFVGVMTLGVAACIVSLLGYLAIPFVYLIRKRATKPFKASLDRHFRRLGHLFTEYLPALVMY